MFEKLKLEKYLQTNDKPKSVYETVSFGYFKQTLLVKFTSSVASIAIWLIHIQLYNAVILRHILGSSWN